MMELVLLTLNVAPQIQQPMKSLNVKILNALKKQVLVVIEYKIKCKQVKQVYNDQPLGMTA